MQPGMPEPMMSILISRSPFPDASHLNWISTSTIYIHNIDNSVNKRLYFVYILSAVEIAGDALTGTVSSNGSGGNPLEPEPRS